MEGNNDKNDGGSLLKTWISNWRKSQSQALINKTRALDDNGLTVEVLKDLGLYTDGLRETSHVNESCEGGMEISQQWAEVSSACSGPSESPGFETNDNQMEENSAGNSEHIQSEEDGMDGEEIMLSQSELGEEQMAESEFEDTAATYMVVRQASLWVYPTQMTMKQYVRAIIEERKERKSDRRKRSKMRSKNMKKKNELRLTLA